MVFGIRLFVSTIFSSKMERKPGLFKIYSTLLVVYKYRNTEIKV